MRLATIFRTGSAFWAFCIVRGALSCSSTAQAQTGRVRPPSPEQDAGPPPRPRAPEHGRRPIELVSELGVSLPTCRGDFLAAPCTALGPAVGATLLALHRPGPFFAFGAGASYSRSSGSAQGSLLEREHFAAGAWGRVYFHEEDAFDPYLELELGYGSLKTTFVDASGLRREDAAFGPSARVGGGLDFFVLPSLRLGTSFGFSHLLIDRGADCHATGCAAEEASGGDFSGALGFGLRATVLFGNEL
jgi:hypothetical protein